jgi:hypothetical protein
LKWRFIDQERDGLGFSISVFPRIIFNIVQSSARPGLSEDGTRFQMPFQIAKKIGIVDLDVECGALASTVGRSEWLYGIVGGIEATKQIELVAELHGTSRMCFDRDVLRVNFGIRQTLTEHFIFIGSLGHEVRAPADESLAFVGYMGVQLLY